MISRRKGVKKYHFKLRKMFRITTKVSNVDRDSMEAFFNRFKKLNHGTYDVYVVDEKPDKSREQMAFYRGCIVPEVARHTGYTERQVHKTFMLAFNPVEIMDLRTGMKVVTAGSLGDANQQDMSNIIQECIDWAWQNLELVIVADKEWREKLKEKRWKEKQFPDEFVIENAFRKRL